MKKVCVHRSFLTLALMGAALSSAAHAAQVTVFAAASLTDAFGEIGRAFEKQSGNSVTFQFAGSQTLRTQLENGARADVFASANSAQYDPLLRVGLVGPGSTFAKNRLVVVAPVGGKVSTLRDLSKPGIKLVLGDKTVPVGVYSRQMLDLLSKSALYGPNFSSAALKNLVSEETNVRQVALKVGLGEADAGVVYVTDVTPDLKGKVKRLYIPTQYNPIASYPIGTVKGSTQPEAAQAFVNFVQGAAGQAILRKWGFLAGEAK